MNSKNPHHTWHDALTRAKSKDHLVEIYQDSRLIAQKAGLFLGTGLQREDSAIVIATKSHWKAMHAFLNDAGVDVAEARETGQLLVLDAKETLDSFMVNGMPDRKKFNKTVGASVRDIQQKSARPSRLRAYGEMVDLLWRDNALVAALLLEEYWNELNRLTPFSLLCSYYMDPKKESHRIPLQKVHGVHSHFEGPALDTLVP